MSETIYYLKKEDIEDKNTLYNYIYTNMENNYYWSDDFSTSFYILLAKAGFITVSNKYDEGVVLLPEIQFEYAVLDFCDLHISKSVKKLLERDDYSFSINEKSEELLESISSYHKDSWLYEEYIQIVRELFSKRVDNFVMMSVELCNSEGELVAGELGYKIGGVYTSLTGFFKKEKRYKNYGKLQMVLLAHYLEKEGFSFWNLGHPFMQYKLDLGAKVYSRDRFLNRWLSETKK